MKKRKLEISYQYLAKSQELEADEQQLLIKAFEAAQLAHAPYSQFHVGCAVLLDSGEIVLGNNQENLAFPSGLCAERTALFHIGAQAKATQISKIAIRAYSTREDLAVDEPVLPCGGCRQVMVEYEKQAARDIVLLSQGATGDILRLIGIRQTLMPFHFDLKL